MGILELGVFLQGFSVPDIAAFAREEHAQSVMRLVRKRW